MSVTRTVVATALTTAALPALVATSAVRAHRARPACATATPASSVEAPAPPRVAYFGYEHQDVVQHVDHGWIGTVRHGRVLGEAAVHWHRSFTRTELTEVVQRLRLLHRR